MLIDAIKDLGSDVHQALTSIMPRRFWFVAQEDATLDGCLRESSKEHRGRAHRLRVEDHIVRIKRAGLRTKAGCRDAVGLACLLEACPRSFVGCLEIAQIGGKSCYHYHQSLCQRRWGAGRRGGGVLESHRQVFHALLHVCLHVLHLANGLSKLEHHVLEFGSSR